MMLQQVQLNPSPCPLKKVLKSSIKLIDLVTDKKQLELVCSNSLVILLKIAIMVMDKYYSFNKPMVFDVSGQKSRAHGSYG